MEKNENAIKTSIMKQKLGELAQSFRAAGEEKANIDYDNLIGQLNQIETAGSVIVHCHIPSCRVYLGKVSDIPRGLSESCCDFVDNHSSNDFTLSIFPDAEREIGKIFGRIRKCLVNKSIGKSKYMTPDVFKSEFMPFYNEQVCIHLKNIKDKIRDQYSDCIEEFSKDVIEAATVIYNNDPIVIHNIMQQIDYFKNLKVESYLSRIHTELDTTFPENIIEDKELRDFFISEKKQYLVSCINDICFELSKDLWDSIFSYVITINKPDIESTISCGHSRFFLDKNCTRIEKNNIAKFPFIKDAISLTRLALKETDVSEANEILLSALSKLYHAIEDLDLPVDSSKIKNPAKSNGVSMNITTHKSLCLPSDKLPSWLTLDTILEY